MITWINENQVNKKNNIAMVKHLEICVKRRIQKENVFQKDAFSYECFLGFVLNSNPMNLESASIN